MAPRTIEIRGVEQLRRQLRRMPEDVRKQVQRPVVEMAERVAATMRDLAPVLTGGLRDAVEVRLARDKMSAHIGPGVRRKRVFRRAGWRAKFAEFGTRHSRAQPFVEPALRQHEDATARALAAAVGRALRAIASRSGR